MYLNACSSYSDHRSQLYIAQMEWPRIVPHEICIYVLYVCYNSENKQQQQQHYNTDMYYIAIANCLS